ncbi:GNAT family N-acetyltransferase [Pedobacter sp. R20-19]|uniref:GNAT family N-acetyltransferase n=1 Tax=Pedobacter sp. R20-19 TaxID=1270196 RepID=UPI0004939916|nr:GNAT family N-acetyltransferase [Pedobacter sp. R20-19]
MMIQLTSINDIDPKKIQHLANNYAIKKNLRDSFPHPYSVEDATIFLELVSNGLVGHVFAISLNSDFIGIGSIIPQNNEHRMNAEIGYWIGEEYWGKDYATEAVKLLVKFAFEKRDIFRVYAYIYDFNKASMRVLEKSGFRKEAILHSSVIKEGKLTDEHLYSILKQQI